MPEELLYRVTSKYFVAGAVVKDGVVVKAAPILKLAPGVTAEWLEQYAEMKKWVIEKIPLMNSDPEHG